MKIHGEKESEAFFWSHGFSTFGQGVPVVSAEQGREALGLLGWLRSLGWLSSWLLPPPSSYWGSHWPLAWEAGAGGDPAITFKTCLDWIPS